MYKSLIIFQLIIMLLGCSSSAGSKEVNVYDSSGLPVDSTIDQGSAKELLREQHVEQDTSQLNTRYDELREAILLDSDALYQVSIGTKQYEAVSDVTWYFDSTYTPRYFNRTWSAEGIDGSAEYVVNGGAVVCAQTEELNSLEKWCSNTGGTLTTWNDMTEDESIKLLPANYASTLAAELEQQLDILKTLLKDGEIVEEDDGSVKIRLESKVNVGMEYTESVEVSIPKELYENLK
jgi:hypothetical protein